MGVGDPVCPWVASGAQTAQVVTLREVLTDRPAGLQGVRQGCAESGCIAVGRPGKQPASTRLADFISRTEMINNEAAPAHAEG